MRKVRKFLKIKNEFDLGVFLNDERDKYENSSFHNDFGYSWGYVFVPLIFIFGDDFDDYFDYSFESSKDGTEI